jgi:energy-coupling factor transporter ATP-binding protein EcfA2
VFARPPPRGAYSGKQAVRGLTLAIQRGECFGLLGPNGAGKSTTLNMLTGFLDPTHGAPYTGACQHRLCACLGAEVLERVWHHTPQHTCSRHAHGTSACMHRPRNLPACLPVFRLINARRHRAD